MKSTIGSMATYYNGKAVFVRTVTSYFVGVLQGVTNDGFMVLQDAAWISVTARFGTMIADGATTGMEAEPYPANFPVFINMASLVDVCEWKHPLLREQ